MKQGTGLVLAYNLMPGGKGQNTLNTVFRELHLSVDETFIYGIPHCCTTHLGRELISHVTTATTSNRFSKRLLRTVRLVLVFEVRLGFSCFVNVHAVCQWPIFRTARTTMN